MKKSFFNHLAFVILLVTFFIPATAQGSSPPPREPSEYEQQTQAFAGRQGANFGKPSDPRVIISNVIRIALTLVGVLFVAYTVYAGVLWMTARGDESQIEKAKSTLRTCVIGILVTISAYAITTFVFGSLRRAASSDEDGFQADFEQGTVSRDAPLCCEWYESAEIQGAFVPDRDSCTARCRNVGADPGTCTSYTVNRSDRCPR